MLGLPRSRSLLSSKRIYLNVLVVALLLVAASINIKSSHDWGDDFAQYILQARNVVQGRPQTDTGVVQNEFSQQQFIPEATPVGFPLLLAPVYAVFGGDILHLGQLLAVFFFLYILFAWLYYRRRHAFLGAALLVLLLAFNPWLLNFKASVLSDIPFAFFTILTIWLVDRYPKANWGLTVAIGLSAGAALAIRPAGLPLIAAIGLYAVYKIVRHHDVADRRAVWHRGLAIALALLVAFGLNSFLFPTGIGRSYYAAWSKRTVSDPTVRSALVSTPTTPVRGTLLDRYRKTLTTQVLSATQIVPRTNIPWVNSLITGCLLLAMGGGLVSCLRRPRLADIFVLLYGLMLVVTQAPNTGLRYLLPVVPFLFEYIYIFLTLIGRKFDVIRSRPAVEQP